RGGLQPLTAVLASANPLRGAKAPLRGRAGLLPRPEKPGLTKKSQNHSHISTVGSGPKKQLPYGETINPSKSFARLHREGNRIFPPATVHVKPFKTRKLRRSCRVPPRAVDGTGRGEEPKILDPGNHHASRVPDHR